MFTIKYKLDGAVNRYKVQLIVRGFTQEYGADYAEIFLPIARLNSIQVLLFVAINQSWELSQLDVKNVFLHGDLTKQVQPPGYVAQGEDRVCLLRKAIYGFK